MLNILVFGQSFLGKIGGVQQSYAWLYEYLCQHGHKITHITHLPIGEDGLHYPFPKEVEIRSMNLIFGKNMPEKIRALTSQIDPDVVLVINSGRNALEFCSALRNTIYSVVLSERGSPEYCISELWKSRRLHELGVWQADFLHMLMPSYPNSLPPDLRCRARVISSLTMPAQIFAKPDQPDEHNRFYILYTGRFSPEKRLPLLIEAFSRLVPDFPLWDLRLVGAGPELGAIEKSINKNNLKNRVTLPGYAYTTDILASHYASSHIYCLPSSYEGCPLAVREAMAHNLPAVGFASCPGTNEIIVDGRNGFLAGQDTAESLAICLRKLMDSPEMRVSMGNAGREDVKKYAPEKTHAAWENLLIEAARWKGRKNKLKLGRMFKNPLRYAFSLMQTKLLDGENWKRDIFARSPWHWLKEVARNPWIFALLNMLYAHQLVSYANAGEVMSYRSRVMSQTCGKKRAAGASAARIAQNAAALAMRHNIRLKNLYGLSEEEPTEK